MDLTVHETTLSLGNAPLVAEWPSDAELCSVSLVSIRSLLSTVLLPVSTEFCGAPFLRDLDSISRSIFHHVDVRPVQFVLVIDDLYLHGVKLLLLPQTSSYARP